MIRAIFLPNQNKCEHKTITALTQTPTHTPIADYVAICRIDTILHIPVIALNVLIADVFLNVPVVLKLSR